MSSLTRPRDDRWIAGVCSGQAGGTPVLLYSPTTGAKGGSTFRYDAGTNQFIFNWDTSYSDNNTSQHPGAGLVLPIYHRYRYDGTLTQALVVPLMRSLFGRQLARRTKLGDQRERLIQGRITGVEPPDDLLDASGGGPAVRHRGQVEHGQGHGPRAEGQRRIIHDLSQPR